MKKTSYIKGTLALFGVLFIFPIVWFIWDEMNYPSILNIAPGDIPNPWTDTLLGYFGSALAAVAGYIAVIITLRIESDARKEDNAKEVLPLISVDKFKGAKVDAIITNKDSASTIKNANDGKHFIGFPDEKDGIVALAPGNHIEIKNVGMREMYDVQVIEIKSRFLGVYTKATKVSPIIYKDASKSLDLYIEVIGNIDGENIKVNNQEVGESNFDDHIGITVAYSDCYDNRYTQEILIDCELQPDIIRSKDVDDSKIVYSGPIIKSCEVQSAPTRIE